MHDIVPAQDQRRWAAVRFALGILQMFGATFSLALLVSTGVSALSLGSVVVTSLLTTVSILLFGGRRSKSPGNSLERG